MELRYVEVRVVFQLEGIGQDVALFRQGCERLLSALARHIRFSDPERAMISYYCKEITAQTIAERGVRKSIGFHSKESFLDHPTAPYLILFN